MANVVIAEASTARIVDDNNNSNSSSTSVSKERRQQQQQQQSHRDNNNNNMSIMTNDSQAKSSSSSSSTSSSLSLQEMILPWSSAICWPLMFSLPLSMTLEWSPLHYTKIFKPEWYAFDPVTTTTPSPLGLCLGLSAVAIGQLFCLIVFYFFKFGYLSGKNSNSNNNIHDSSSKKNNIVIGEPTSIQTKGARPYEFYEGLTTHLAQPEGFILLGAYLSITWMLRIMPDSYYSFENGIEWHKVFMCLALQDGIQYIMHRLEHDASSTFYIWSHKPHHKFTNPRLFDAFNGSVLDTICMILIPLIITAQVMNTVNVWTYMAFGSSYANWLTLIHSEYTFPWDNTIFHKLGFGTPADHHVHHAFFKYNYGHLFMWFDMIGGTYKNPKEYAPKAFNENV